MSPKHTPRRVILRHGGHFRCLWCGRAVADNITRVWEHADDCWTGLDLADAIRARNPVAGRSRPAHEEGESNG